MKFSRFNFKMQRFESRSPSQPVCLQRITYEIAQKPRGTAGRIVCAAN